MNVRRLTEHGVYILNLFCLLTRKALILNPNFDFNTLPYRFVMKEFTLQTKKILHSQQKNILTILSMVLNNMSANLLHKYIDN